MTPHACPHCGSPVPPHGVRRGGLTVDVGQHSVSWEGRSVRLHAGSWAALCLLIYRPGEWRSSRHIINVACSGGERCLPGQARDVIKRLRRDLRAIGAAHMVKHWRGLGYCWAVPE